VQHVLDSVIAAHMTRYRCGVRAVKSCVEIARRHDRIDPALLELDRHAVLLVHDRRMENAVAGPTTERRGEVLVGATSSCAITRQR
jgi:hypothetical protein